MSDITDPTEEYFKDGLWGWVTDQWKKLVGDDAGHLQVDVVESGLPSGAATSANQTTMITALQLIDDLRNALDSVATDELLTIFHSQDVDVEIKQTTAADLTPGAMGWDGSVWRKLPMLWGYSDRYAENKYENNVAAGDRSLSFTSVPAGEVWVVQHVVCYCTTANPSYMVMVMVSSAGESWLARIAPVAANTPLVHSGEITLKEDDYIKAYFFGCSLNDDIRAHALGCKMRVTE